MFRNVERLPKRCIPMLYFFLLCCFCFFLSKCFFNSFSFLSFHGTLFIEKLHLFQNFDDAETGFCLFFYELWTFLTLLYWNEGYAFKNNWNKKILHLNNWNTETWIKDVYIMDIVISINIFSITISL